MDVKILRLNADAVIPSYQTSGAAGFDLVATDDAMLMPGYVVTNQNGDSDVCFEPAIVGTGLAFEIPEGYELEIRGRSGLAFKYNVFSFNGTIDADYRGEVKLLLYNMSDKPFYIAKGDRVAQGVIKPIVQASFIEVDELGETERGKGGFGSTGTKS